MASVDNDIPIVAGNTVIDDPRERVQAEFDLGNPSLRNLNRDYLHNNFTKVELQKRCRQLKVKNVWGTKDELIDKILSSVRDKNNETVPVLQDVSASDTINKILSEIVEIKEKLASKDLQIQELNIMLKTTHVTINRLNDRISTLEEQVRHPPVIGSVSEDNEKIFLLGDENLDEVRLSDLGDNCSVRTIKDTTLDLAGCWVSERLDWMPTKCIIYCGTNDLIENDNPDNVLDDLGALVSELKRKDENISLFVCELAPSLQVDLDQRINRYNEKLKDWCSVNGVNLIKTNLNFKMGTGDIDELCFDDQDDGSVLHLNRHGALRLLSAINKQCDFFKVSHGSRRTSDHQSSRQFRNDSHFSTRRTSDIGQSRQTRDYRNSGYNNYFQRMTNERPHNRNSPRESQFTSGYQYDNGNRNNFNRRGCYNCGEYNHVQANCRHDHQVRCTNCYSYGHKSRFCHASNF